MVESQLILLAQLLGTAFPAGLNLYATVAILGLASRLGWIATLPPGLRGLENGFVIGSALTLYLVEFVVDKVPNLDSLWDAIHTAIRPSAAALLTLAATAGLAPELRLAAATLAGLVALAAHGGKAGLRLAINAAPVPARRKLISIAEDVLAMGVAVVALRYPTAALFLAGAALALVLVAGPLFWRAFVFGIRALHARLRALFTPGHWRGIDHVPGDLRRLVEAPPLGAGAPRAARVAVRGLGHAGAYRNGWLVVSAGRPVFVYRSILRPRRLEIPGASEARARTGLWADTLEIDDAGTPLTLYLLKDGPRAETLRDEILTVIA